ncbi:MAG: hypothetical protein ABII88_04005 [Candidatus Omnitrophota bacterium]
MIKRHKWLKITAIILIQAFLLLDFAWAGAGSVVFSGAAECLSPKLQISNQVLGQNFSQIYIQIKKTSQDQGFSHKPRYVPQRMKIGKYRFAKGSKDIALIYLGVVTGVGVVCYATIPDKYIATAITVGVAVVGFLLFNYETQRFFERLINKRKKEKEAKENKQLHAEKAEAAKQKRREKLQKKFPQGLRVKLGNFKVEEHESVEAALKALQKMIPKNLKDNEKVKAKVRQVMEGAEAKIKIFQQARQERKDQIEQLRVNLAQVAEQIDSFMETRGFDTAVAEALPAELKKDYQAQQIVETFVSKHRPGVVAAEARLKALDKKADADEQREPLIGTKIAECRDDAQNLDTSRLISAEDVNRAINGLIPKLLRRNSNDPRVMRLMGELETIKLGKQAEVAVRVEKETQQAETLRRNIDAAIVAVTKAIEDFDSTQCETLDVADTMIEALVPQVLRDNRLDKEARAFFSWLREKTIKLRWQVQDRLDQEEKQRRINGAIQQTKQTIENFSLASCAAENDVDDKIERLIPDILKENKKVEAAAKLLEWVEQKKEEFKTLVRKNLALQEFRQTLAELQSVSIDNIEKFITGAREAFEKVKDFPEARPLLEQAKDTYKAKIRQEQERIAQAEQRMAQFKEIVQQIEQAKEKAVQFDPQQCSTMAQVREQITAIFPEGIRGMIVVQKIVDPLVADIEARVIQEGVRVLEAVEQTKYGNVQDFQQDLEAVEIPAAVKQNQAIKDARQQLLSEGSSQITQRRAMVFMSWRSKIERTHYRDKNKHGQNQELLDLCKKFPDVEAAVNLAESLQKPRGEYPGRRQREIPPEILEPSAPVPMRAKEGEISKEAQAALSLIEEYLQEANSAEECNNVLIMLEQEFPNPGRLSSAVQHAVRALRESIEKEINQYRQKEQKRFAVDPLHGLTEEQQKILQRLHKKVRPLFVHVLQFANAGDIDAARGEWEHSQQRWVEIGKRLPNMQEYQEDIKQLIEMLNALGVIGPRKTEQTGRSPEVAKQSISSMSPQSLVSQSI